MKRVGNLFQQIISKDNISLALSNACKTKRNHRIVKKALSRSSEAIDYLHNNFHISGKYKLKNHIDSSSGKVRELCIPPYFPDQVVQHAVTQITEPYIMKKILPECCCSIKNRGLLYASNIVRKALSRKNIRYFVKFDIKKFFPNINHDILYNLICDIFKDKQVLEIYKEIIYSADGLPIGNYTSQTLANLYLTPLDRYIKQELKIPYFVRYMDDFIILSSNKRELKKVIPLIKSFLKDRLLLSTHNNERVIDIYDTPIDFCGFKHYKTYTTIRKRIWKRTRRCLLRQQFKFSIKRCQRLMSYLGYIIHSNSFNILNRYKGTITKSRLILKGDYKNGKLSITQC